MLGRNESDARHDKGKGTSEVSSEIEIFEESADVIEIISIIL